MANWKKVVVSGSNVSQLNNDAGYITAGTLLVPNLFSTASFNGVNLLANSISGTLNFASSSTQGLTIAADAGSDTLTFGLAAIPNTSLANSSVSLGSQTLTLGAAATTTLTGLTSVTSTTFVGNLTGTASFATSASQANTANSATTATTASYITTLNQDVIISGALDISLSPYSSNLQIAGNGFGQTYLSSNGALILNPGSGGVGMAGVNQYITAGYFQGQTAGSYLTGSLQGTASFANTATSSSYANNATSASYASFAATAPYSGLTGVPAGLVSGSSQISYSGITGVPANIVSASVLSSPSQGSAILTTNGVAGSTIDLGLQTGDSPTFAGVTAGNITVGVTTDNTIGVTGDLSIDTSGGTVTINDNLVVTNNLTVQGTASFQNTTNLEVADRFILMASGSNTTGDGGIVVQQATQNIGEAFAWDSGVSRWGVTGSFTANNASYTPDAFMAAVTTAAGTTPAPASRYNAVGNIYVSSGDESIWIYS